MLKTVPIIVGPTAVGKTALSVLLAKKMDAEIVSADSRQIFKYLDIGTAKVSADIQREIPHHFIDILTPDQYYSAGMFGKEARIKLSEIQARQKWAVVVGGSGLYINALVDGIFELDKKDRDLQQRLRNRLEHEGFDVLFDELRDADPEYAAKLNRNDKQRMLRGIEVFLQTGRNLTEWRNQSTTPADFKAIYFGLEMKREDLNARINQRVDEMFSAGLVEEVKKIIELGYHKDLNALNTVGYKEVFAYLESTISFDEMKELIKRNSRRYAKRQMTWFRSNEKIRWFQVENENDLESIGIQITTDLSKLAED